MSATLWTSGDTGLSEDQVEPWYAEDLELVRRPGWRTRKSGPDYTAWTRPMPGCAYHAIKIVASLGAPARDVGQLITTDFLARHGEWSALFHSGRVVERLGAEIDVVYTRFNSPTRLAGSRDYLYLRGVRRSEGGGVHVVTRSILHRDCPEVPGVVRGEVLLSSHVVEPVGETRSRYTLVVLTTPRGKLPAALVNRLQVGVCVDEVLAKGRAARR